ncbi:MAG: ABC transporter permease subunit [Aquabacterium sp.]
MLAFLTQPAGFDIGETGLMVYDAAQPLWRALLVGLGNTLRVALPALLGATLLGVLMALARTSRMRVWQAIGSGYVEVVRNTPLLLQLLMWYFLLIEWLPDSTQAWSIAPGVWLSKGGLAFPWWATDPETGAAAWSWPVQEAFNVLGGAAVTPEYMALALALSIYTSAFLSEVIRAGMESVPASLIEAAQTLGATRFQQIVKVLLPQAFRAIVPAATNQYLNIFKNSSLAVAIGYPDLVSVGNTAINQTGRAVECVLVMMVVYLTLSLLTSLFMNWFNARHALKGAT